MNANTPPSPGPNIKGTLQQTAQAINQALDDCLSKLDGPSSRLVEAMQFSLEGGGKRLRPTLVVWCCELCGGTQDAAIAPALAVECIHTFSLIHDDLPALDDDDLRRGRASCHKQFGEAAAILAGDALLALAFEVLASRVDDPRIAAAMIRELAVATGVGGMIGGEAADLEGESAPPNPNLVAKIHTAKTSRLIEAACRLGGLAAKAADREISALGAHGRALGLAFQAVDDILDVTGRSEVLGKTAGKDQKASKQTYPRAVGMEASRRIAREAAEQAVAALEPFGERAAKLIDLARFVVERES